MRCCGDVPWGPAVECAIKMFVLRILRFDRIIGSAQNRRFLARRTCRLAAHVR